MNRPPLHAGLRVIGIGFALTGLLLGTPCCQSPRSEGGDHEWLPWQDIASEAPAEATAAWLLAAHRPEQAFEVLRTHGARNAASWGTVGNALEQTGQRVLAFEAYRYALEHDIWELDWLDAMIALDPERAFAVLQSILRDYPLDAEESLAEIHDGYAHCLHGLGRDEEAARLLGAPEECVRAPIGCVGWAIRGEPWEWEVWRAARPGDVALVLRPILDDNLSSRDFAFRQLIELASDEKQRSALLRLYEQKGDYDPILLATMASRSGDDSYWKKVERLVEESPENSALALPLAHHLERSGRGVDAARVRLDWIAHDQYCTSELRKLLISEREIYLPLLIQRSEFLAVREPRPDEEEALDEQIGRMAGLLREFGFEKRAVELYQRARQLDPLDGEWWEALRPVYDGIESNGVR